MRRGGPWLGETGSLTEEGGIDGEKQRQQEQNGRGALVGSQIVNLWCWGERQGKRTEGTAGKEECTESGQGSSRAGEGEQAMDRRRGQLERREGG